MDLALIALITAWVKFANAQFDAASPADKAILAKNHAEMSILLFNGFMKVHDDVHGAADKVKEVLHVGQ